MPQQSASAFRLCGEQTVRTIADTHRALVECYATPTDLTFDASMVTDADLTLVQLIESARRTAARNGKHVCISGPLPDSLRDVLIRGGFLNSPDNALFWTAP